jgi:serine-type D-Ala-D-Ala carboxypeptidase
MVRTRVRRRAASAAAGVLLTAALVAPVMADDPGGTARGEEPAGAGEADPTGNARERAAVWDRGHQPPRTLREGTARQAGLSAEHLEAMDAAIAAGLEPSPDVPRYPGAVVLAGRDGVIAKHDAYGHALRYVDDAPTELPADQQLPMHEDTIFDLASISKLFTAVAVMQLVEDGALDLDAPVAETIPAFAASGKDEVTARHLLAHTGGLPAWLPLWSAYDTPEERLAAVYEVEPASEPGEAYVYSDLGLIVLGEMVETITGQGLDEVVAERITGPLGMQDTGYNPDPALVERIAATEYQPLADRGLVHGEVHDENAWSLDGVAGHAGVFSTAADLAVFAQTFLNGGRYGDARILEPETVQEMMRNQTPGFPGNERGLGFELYQHWYMDAMTTPGTAGHTGFTGTSLVIDPTTDSFVVFLTNRVHPSRSWAAVNPARRSVAQAVARAVPVEPVTGTEAWFSGLGDGLDHDLEVDLTLPGDGTELSLGLWYDTAPGDVATVEISTDGGASWEPLAGELTARRAGDNVETDGTFTGWGQRRWWDASFDLSAHEGEATLRVRYLTEGLGSGRGVYIDKVRVHGPAGPVFDDQRPADLARWRHDGWTRAGD